MDVHLTELEEQLAQTDGAQVQLALLNRLDALAWRLRLRLQSGVARAEFPALESAMEAVQAAQQVLTDWPVPAHTSLDNSPFQEITCR